MAKKLDDILNKKKEAPPNDKMAKIASSVAALKKKFGEESVNFLGNKKAEPLPRFSSGGIAIDKILGGGFPEGRMIEIFGPASSGKTTICYHAIAEVQKKYPNNWCGFVDSEQSFDSYYAEAIGVNVGELVVAQPDTGTDAFGMVQGMVEMGAKLIVIDSVAAMMPKEEAEEEDYGHNSIGAQARMMSKGLRKLTAIAGKHKCTIMFTNQIRNKIGVMFGCFNKMARVVLADGSTMPIGKIVKTKYNGLVKTLNKETGLIENKQIINWFDNGVGERWYKVSVQKGSKQGIARFVVGDDHTFITPAGEQKLSELKVGDEVLVRGVHLPAEETVCVGRIVGIEETKPHRDDNHKYDIQIEDNANYFVDDVCVHNSPEVTSGGKALEYYASVRLRVSQCGKVEETNDGEKTITAIQTRLTTSKNKTFAPFKTCEIVIRFGEGIDNDAGILDLAFQYGIIKKGGGGIYTVGTDKIKGLPALKEYLEKYPDLYEDIQKRTYAAMEREKQEVESEEPVDADNMTDDEIAEAAEKKNDDDVGEV